ncbi:FAD-binding and (Fe-S)-binding domain-containing protein [Runella salmonicolor]|uniref:FAD-binding protein n=1 Tax=Runella salmonicolor TaxID=2950278 RepID=A0ABT1FVG6_9BACT|nr:FAD-binding and (Fe-S)-binding domain-containing protein [Runella salmonicolor]MCP1385763.1 FAD-binding protein [Runella salmonicolor]
MFYAAPTKLPFQQLTLDFEGEFYFDNSVTHQAIRRLYSTDASVYQETPLAVALPKTVGDIQQLILFAVEHGLTLIPRAAGTSLAGQVVGEGIVVDISKYFDKILEINADERWVRVQPGVIRDDLNVVLKPYGLMFGPETSTANRAMIGGMIGNNSCGLHSIRWGATRDHLLEVKAILSDGSEVIFGEQSVSNQADSLRERIEKGLSSLLSDAGNQKLIREKFPKKTVTRRNSGYALDALLDAPNGLNLPKLIAGSEGTLCFITEAKLNLLPLPPAELGLLCVHCHTLHESLLANGIAMKHHPLASELVDKYIMDFTKEHNEYRHNRFFIEGDPAAMLMVEFGAETRAEVETTAKKLVAELKLNGLGYAYPLLFGDESKKAWDVRKAGLGLIRNLPGDLQPVNLIEDCAVAVEDLPNYIEDLGDVLKKHQVHASYYAHAGAGELHVEPMVNLKTSEGKAKFRAILADTAVLLKKYNGSLSGEHGDGRLRGEFIPFMMGEEVYGLFREVKNLFDPKGVFNRGKIVDTPPMNEFLRYQPDQKAPHIETVFDFSKQESLLRLAEKCSGSGDCRKTHITGGTMCPSYMATRRERDTTRARANMLRHFYTESSSVDATAEETKEILDLCLSCKGCKSECPSSVDISKMKAEFLQSYYDKNGVPFRSRLIANFSQQMRLASIAPWAYNSIFGNESLRRIANKVVGFHPDRTMPMLAKTTLKDWHKARTQSGGKRVYLFCDEFTNYNDVEIGQKAILLLEKLGYEVIIPKHVESGRTYLSKGLVKEAKKIAIQNVEMLKEVISEDTPLIGIEPSAILTFRDEYLDLVPKELQETAQKLAKNALQFEEFIAREIDTKRIHRQQFTNKQKTIKLHGHCHQKALSSLTPSKKMLSLPENYTVQLIHSGCCGMAGSFGYEKEHYELSMQVGELVLFPTVRQQPEEVIIAAPGTSCRHQIKDGTGRKAKHPIEILWEALRS